MCRHRGAVIGCRAPQTLQSERGLGRPAGAAVVVAVEDARTPATPFVALSAVRTSVHLVAWTAGVQATGVHATGVIPVSGQPGVRTARRPDSQASGVCGRCVRAVRTALDPGRRCRGTGHVGGPGSTCRGGPERLGRRRPNPAWRGQMVERWQCLAGHECRRQTWAAASQSHRLRCRARRLADQESWSSARVPVGWLGSTRGSRCSQVPRRCVLGRLPAYCSTWGWTGRW
jgi:hypothetical protein